MRNGNQRNSSWSSPLHCETGLDLKMQLQPASSFPCDGGGAGSFFNGSTNHLHAYDLTNALLLQRTQDYSASRPSGGIDMNVDMMGVCGKALFTASQLQELERQKMIHKYILASIPVPPQLLLSTSTSPHPSSLSQCNTGVDLRYSSSTGSDPEPWRCKRTDGKKWRCSRDVAPDQKYCERHAHKNRPRSRKHVENSPHNYSHKPFVLPSNHSNPTTNLPVPSISSTNNPFHQTRCFEWLMRGGNREDVSESKQQLWEKQLMQMSPSSSRMDEVKDNHHLSVYHPHFGEKQGLNSETRVFIDAWGKEEVGSKEADKKLWPLSLSMGDDGKNEWQNNPVSWINSSSPGGPLGEALCLGNASGNTSHGGGGGTVLASVYGHGISNTNSRSSCCKSSCEDGSHALNFIG